MIAMQLHCLLNHSRIICLQLNPVFMGCVRKVGAPHPYRGRIQKFDTVLETLKVRRSFAPIFTKKIPMIKVINLNLNLADFWKKYLFIISCYKFMKFINYII